ncbi:hypothetical protein CR513_04548, partial [Mucuna pruriens]
MTPLLPLSMIMTYIATLLEKSLEEKVVQLMHNHKEQSEQIGQQNQQMQLILYHLQLKSLVSNPIPPNTNEMLRM